MDFLVIVGFVAFAAMTLALARAVTGARNDTFRRLATGLELPVVHPASARDALVAPGPICGMRSTLSLRWVSRGKRTYPLLEVEILDLNREIRVGLQPNIFTMNLFGSNEPDLVVGDSRLDPRVGLDGPELVLRSLLDAPTRAALAWVAEAGTLTVERGGLNLEVELDQQDDGELRDLVLRTAELASRLRHGPLDVERLLQIAEADPLPRIRLGALAAALSLPSADDRARFAALAEAAESAVERALGDLLRGDPATLSRLPAEAARQVAPLAPEPVTALLAEAGAEAQLIALLRAEQAPVVSHAIAALHRTGTARAVEGLSALGSSGPHQEAARRAIQAIQARIGPRERGALSLDERGGERGRLSVTGTAGALSEGGREGGKDPK